MRVGNEFGGNPIRALSEDRHAVHHKGERLTPLVGLAAHVHAAQTQLELLPVDALASNHQIDFNLIKRLVTVAVGPPQLRIFDLDRRSSPRVPALPLQLLASCHLAL